MFWTQQTMYVGGVISLFGLVLIIIGDFLGPANDIFTFQSHPHRQCSGPANNVEGVVSLFRILLIIGNVLGPANDVGGVFSLFRLILIDNVLAQQTRSERYFQLFRPILICIVLAQQTMSEG